MLFRDITGQQLIKEKLVKTVVDQRVSHAQLFFGPEGNEKLALAIAYAQFINCQNRHIPVDGDLSKADSCGVCPSCIKYQKLIHPDLHFIYPISTTKKVKSKPKSINFIEDWRSFLISNDYHVGLQDWYDAIGMENKQGIINAEDCTDIITTLSYKSYESEYKVMILWMVEKLYHSAAPKILKILEEPPEKTLFILLAEDPEQIISTIRSRTLLIKIPALDVNDVAEYLIRKYQAGEREAGIIARQSKGNLRVSVSRFLKQGEENQNFITFRQWMLDCYARKYPVLVAFAAEIAKTGREKQKGFLSYALKTVSACGAISAGNSNIIIAEEKEKEFFTNISKFINLSNLEQFKTLFDEAIFHIERNASAQILFLDLSLKAVRLFTQPVKK
ncbi:MAG: ATP-binding protein [Syntrophothermus sp.]